MNTQLNNIDEHFIFDSISTYYEENSLFSYNGYCGEVDSCGRVLFVIKAEEIARASDNSFFVKINGKWGLYSECFEVVIEPQYEELREAYNHLEECFWAKLNNKYGIITRNNTCLTGFIYDFEYGIFNAAKGYFIVEKDNKRGVIDIYGHIIFDLIYDDIQILWSQGYVSLNGKQALINENGVFIKIDSDSLNNCIEKCNRLKNLEKSFALS